MAVVETTSKLISTLVEGNTIIDRPSGLQVGDLMVAIVFTYPYSNSCSASGWTSISTNMPDQNNYVGYAVFKKIADSSDVSASTFTFTQSQNSYNGGIIYRIQKGDFNKVQFASSGGLTPQSKKSDIILFDVTGDNDGDSSTFSGYSITGGTNPTFTEVYDNCENSYMRNSMGSAWALYESESAITAYNITATNSGVDYEFKCMILVGNYLEPTVTTQAVTSITATTAIGNGNITDIGSSSITRRGFCLKTGTMGDPTVSDTVFYDDGTFSTGTFIKDIINLTRVTDYRVRAYCINSIGTSYGSTVDLKTLAILPTVTTVKVNSITQSSFIANGNLVDDGGETTEIGFVCGTSLNPTILDNKVIVTGGMGAFSTLISGLTANTVYHVRAYATNTIGTTYGTDIAFSSLASGPMVKRRVSFLSKAQSLTIQLSNNAVDETFTVLQFAVAGEKQEKKTFTPGSIVSIN